MGVRQMGQQRVRRDKSRRKFLNTIQNVLTVIVAIAQHVDYVPEKLG